MTRKRRRSKKWIYYVLILVLIAAAGAVGYKVWEEYFQDEQPSGEQEAGRGYDEPGEPSQTEQAEDSSGIESKGSAKDDVGTGEPEKVSQYDGANPNISNDITGVVTYAGVSGETLVVRVSIDQYLTSGSCALTLVRDGAEIYDEMARVIDSASTSTCEGFNVPLSKFDGTGKINIKIKVTAGEKSGIIDGEVKL